MATCKLSKSNCSKMIELTQCPICMETLTNPKCLPCIHTFCLECLEKCGMDKQPGDELTCPICRAPYKIPRLGFPGLKSNFFIQEMLEDLESKNCESAELKCDACDAEASAYCLECDQQYCRQCTVGHSKMRVSASHKVVSIEQKECSRTDFIQAKPRHCEVHSDEQLKVYCYDCNTPICLMCAALIHKLHCCEDLKEAARRFVEQLQKDQPEFDRCAQENKTELQQLEVAKETFLQQIAKGEQGIAEKRRQMQQLINDQSNQLLVQLYDFKSAGLKEIATRRDEIELQLTIVENFKQYVDELTGKASACDISLSAADLLSRSDALLKSQNQLSYGKLGEAQVGLTEACTPSEVSDATGSIGHLTLSGFHEGDMLIVVGPNAESKEVDPEIVQEVWRVSVDLPSRVLMLPAPAQIQQSPTACILEDTLYVVGVGCRQKEVWCWKSAVDATWVRCRDLSTGRYKHSAAGVDGVLYVLGGLRSGTSHSIENSVITYDWQGNKWSTCGQLSVAVHSAACVAYKGSIFVFGGLCGGTYNGFRATDHIQKYNVAEKTCAYVSSTPGAHDGLRAALWGNSAIVIGELTCFVFNLDTRVVQKRLQFKTGSTGFGLTINKETLFITGGSRPNDCTSDNKGCSDEIKSLSVRDVIGDKQAGWQLHGKLPRAACLETYGLVTMSRAS